MKNTLGFKSLLSCLGTVACGLADNRKAEDINYSYYDAIVSNFAVMHFQDSSLLQFQRRMEQKSNSSNLKTIFEVKNIPSDSTMRTLLDGIDSVKFESSFVGIVELLKSSKQLEKFQTLKGKYLCALDGSQYHSSQNIHCEKCLKKEHKKGTVTYSHETLVPAIVHPSLKEILPLMPEAIANEDGNTKQDCENNAAKRLIPKLKQYGLELIITGDALYANKNLIKAIKDQGFNYFLTFKGDNRSLTKQIKRAKNMRSKEVVIGKKKYLYQWLNDVSLNLDQDSPSVNYFSLDIINLESGKTIYYSSWVTDLKIEGDLVEAFAEGARSRWKIENECFNVLKNHGYEMEHNYGHGTKNLAHNYFILTLLALLFHQVHELVDNVYQKLRVKEGSKKNLWNILRALIQYILFECWEDLLRYALDPPEISSRDLRGLAA